MDGDGKDDVITGHYWPGDIFLFRGEGSGEFGEMENLQDETGRNLNAGEPWENEDEPRMASLAAAPYATDFDGDGDFDMLIGNIVGEIVLMENVGSATEPSFSTDRRTLQAAGETIRVGGGDSGPVFEDWNADGKRDLLTGAGDGSVWFFENVGEDTAPVFAEGVALVEAHEDAWTPYANGTEPPRPGLRTKVCVTDYDGDGLVDLLVGGYQREKGVEPDLDESQVALRDKLRREREEIQGRLIELYDAEEQDEEAVAELNDRHLEVREALTPLEARDISHGFVWFLRRLPETSATAGSGF